MIKNQQKGFTIVELLIVVVVIGILAAIVIVAYNGIQNSANEAAVKSDLAQFAKNLEIYKTKNGAYPSSRSHLENANVKITRGSYVTNRNNVYYYIENVSQHYALGVIAASGSQYYLVDGNVSDASGVGYSGTRDEVETLADQDGLDTSEMNITSAGAGYDDPNDGSGDGWQDWTE
tara:strand:- start:8937 stop:9464 length:528 start_codon:yes stop_codon:yes gene_type:complete